MLKTAYEMGVQLALEEVGLLKTAGVGSKLMRAAKATKNYLTGVDRYINLDKGINAEDYIWPKGFPKETLKNEIRKYLVPGGLLGAGGAGYALGKNT